MKAIGYITSAALLAIASMPATSQNLTQEILVEQEIVVDHHDATKQAISPTLTLPPVTLKPLAFSERTVSIAIPANIPFLEPTAYADTLVTSPYNGYAVLGYCPIYNLGASAGYRILDNDHSRLNAWMQYNGTAYKDTRTLGEDSRQWIRRNTVSAGVAYHLMIGMKSELDAGLDYTYGRFNAPGVEIAPGTDGLYNQSINHINASLQWVSSVQGLSYTAGFDYSHFAYRRGYINQVLAAGNPEALNGFLPVRENNYMANAAGALPLSDNSSVYFGVDLSVINNTRYAGLGCLNDGNFNYVVTPGNGHFNHSLLTLKPRYRYKNDNLQATFGALIEFTMNAGKVFHIAPEAKLSWTPTGVLTLWAKATGGVHQNTLSSLYDVNYLTAPMLAYRNSNIPLEAEGGFRAGPFKGGYVELYGGYSIANDWLMPTGFMNTPDGPTMFTPIDLKGWHAGVAIGYKYRSLIEGKVKAEAAPSKYNRGYYQWRDRAKYMLKAEVTAYPIENLEVGAGYELRARRSMIDRCLYASDTDIHFVEAKRNLGNISNLSINAAYRFTPQLSVFLVGENLLNHRNTTLGLIEAQGITGLAGVSYKF